jgi:hypothetical protein
MKATASMGAGACVQLARDGDMIALRDSKSPETPPLHYTRQEIAAFLDGARSGEFDHLTVDQQLPTQQSQDLPEPGAAS